MGWNCVIGVIADTNLSDLADADFTVEASTVTGEVATSMEFTGIAVQQVGEALVLLNSDLGLVDQIDRLRDGLNSDVHVANFASTADTYWWRVTGPSGDREWLFSEHEQVLDSGTRHAAEEGIEELDEDTLFTILDRLIGTEDYLERDYHPLAAAPAKKKRWFSRG